MSSNIDVSKSTTSPKKNEQTNNLNKSDPKSSNNLQLPVVSNTKQVDLGPCSAQASLWLRCLDASLALRQHGLQPSEVSFASSCSGCEKGRHWRGRLKRPVTFCSCFCCYSYIGLFDVFIIKCILWICLWKVLYFWCSREIELIRNCSEPWMLWWMCFWVCFLAWKKWIQRWME